jgi:hypothetical protein
MTIAKGMEGFGRPENIIVLTTTEDISLQHLELPSLGDEKSSGDTLQPRKIIERLHEALIPGGPHRAARPPGPVKWMAARVDILLS